MMSKYDSLNEYLSKCAESKVVLSLSEIESIIGDKLPQSAYNHAAWWENSRTKDHLQSRAWTECGYKTVDVAENLKTGTVIFEK
jgi:hypothetical protein